MYLAATNTSNKKRPTQQFSVGLRQVREMAVTDMEVAMRLLMTGSLILMAAVALLATGCDNQARAPKEWAPQDAAPGMSQYNVAEVVVTAERPGRLMPEVVASANLMPEVVVYASWTPAALSALPAPAFVN
jgi:hypothetical protein